MSKLEVGFQYFYVHNNRICKKVKGFVKTILAPILNRLAIAIGFNHVTVNLINTSLCLLVLKLTLIFWNEKSIKTTITLGTLRLTSY